MVMTYQEFKEEEGVTLLFRDDGEPVADIHYILAACEVDHFYVYPKFRRKGLGLMILMMTEKKLKADGCTRIHVWLPIKEFEVYKGFWIAEGYTIKIVEGRIFPRAEKVL